jgi:hypothetical protein
MTTEKDDTTAAGEAQAGDENGNGTIDALLHNLETARKELDALNVGTIFSAFRGGLLHGKVWMTQPQVDTIGSILSLAIYAGMAIGSGLVTDNIPLDFTKMFVAASEMASGAMDTFVAGYDGFTHDENVLREAGVVADDATNGPAEEPKEEAAP